MFGGEWVRSCGSLGRGACPLLKESSRVERKTKVKRFIRYDSKCAVSNSLYTFENPVQHTTREYEGGSPSCLGENGSAMLCGTFGRGLAPS